MQNSLGISRSPTPPHSVYLNDPSQYPLYSKALDDQLQPLPPKANQQVEDRLVPRSRWPLKMIFEPGAWSEESMRKLRYVLQWLQVTILFISLFF